MHVAKLLLLARYYFNDTTQESSWERPVVRAAPTVPASPPPQRPQPQPSGPSPNTEILVSTHRTRPRTIHIRAGHYAQPDAARPTSTTAGHVQTAVFAAPAASAAATSSGTTTLTLAQIQDAKKTGSFGALGLDPVTLPLHGLIVFRHRPSRSGLGQKNLEMYLSDAEFEAVLKCPRAAFQTKPQWKQELEKRKAGLF